MIIKVQRRNAELLEQSGIDAYKTVGGAILVGGEDGVFAAWRESRKSQEIPDLIHLAAGDDGNWWEIGAYCESWLPDIIKALESV